MISYSADLVIDSSVDPRDAHLLILNHFTYRILAVIILRLTFQIKRIT